MYPIVQFSNYSLVTQLGYNIFSASVCGLELFHSVSVPSPPPSPCSDANTLPSPPLFTDCWRFNQQHILHRLALHHTVVAPPAGCCVAPCRLLCRPLPAVVAPPVGCCGAPCRLLWRPLPAAVCVFSWPLLTIVHSDRSFE